MQRKTKIVAMEGIDGSGKTIQMSRLIERLEQRSYKVKELSFPVYGSFFGEQIGDLLSGEWVLRADQIDSRSMCLWFALDRWKAFQNFDYADCDFLLINRYTLSNAVYQAIRPIDRGMSDNWSWVKRLEHEQFDLPVPDLYLLLDLDADLAQQNVDHKGVRHYVDGRDVYEDQKDLLTRARARYLDIASQEETIKVISCMDGERQISPEFVSQRLWDAFKAAFKIG